MDEKHQTGSARKVPVDRRIERMSPWYEDVKYVAFDSDPGGHPSATRCSFASAKHTGHLFLTAILFTSVSAGVPIGRWATMPDMVDPTTHFIL